MSHRSSRSSSQRGVLCSAIIKMQKNARIVKRIRFPIITQQQCAIRHNHSYVMFSLLTFLLQTSKEYKNEEKKTAERAEIKSLV